MTLGAAGARVLRALREGAELAMHARQTGRGPYYTLGGRRLSVVTLKALEERRFIRREGRGVYLLTPLGEAALAEWEGRSPDHPAP